MADERDALKRIEENASDTVELLKGLESTAQIVFTLGFIKDAPDIETEDVANMMYSFREQLEMIRNSVEGIADMADKALLAKSKEIAAVK